MVSSPEKAGPDSVEPGQGQDVQHTHTDDGSMKDYARVFSFADSVDWALNSFALIGSIGSGAALPLMAIVFGGFVTNMNDFTIGRTSPSEFRSEVSAFTLWFVYLFIGKLALTYIFTVSISISATRTTKALRTEFLEQTLRQDIAFFESSSEGAVATQVTTNGNLIEQGIAEKLALAVQAVATFFAAFIVAFTVQWKLTLITICIAPAILLVTTIGVWIDMVQEGRILQIYSMAGSLAEEAFSSIRTVQSFWAHPRLSRDFDKQLAAAEKEGYKKSPNLAILYSTEFFCIYCGYALCFWQGVRMYARGEIQQPGDIITVLLAVVIASTSITQIAPHLTAFAKAGSAASDLFMTMDRLSKIDPFSKDGLSPDTVTGDIQFRDIHFAYPSRPGYPVLKGLSLSLPANKTTALLGPSGCGKSTVIGLLERWYELVDGKIFLDGTDIAELNVKWLRTQVRLVQQEPVLFMGTVFENVANGLMGLPSADLPDDEKLILVQEACKLANAHDFIMQLPFKYQTQVGERASMLSGGQKQRIAIARSIISDPKILLLDEATSALDSSAEKVVQDALDKASRFRTTLVISHKLKTIQNADNIVLISEGMVAEQGTHDELLAAGGRYAGMVAAQDLGFKDLDWNEMPDSILQSTKEIELVPSFARQVAPHTPMNDKVLQEEQNHSANYSLIKCLKILLWEQKDLWPWFIVVVIVSFPAGLTYLGQAILFARETAVFQLEGDSLIRGGDFYSLMFFVIALANLLAYFVLGWVSNIIAQVSTRRYRLEMFNNILRQDMEFFDRVENTAGALTSRLSTQPTSLQELLCFNLSLMLITVINLIASCILALVVGPKLGAVVVFGALPPLLVAGYVRIRLEQRLNIQASKRFADSAGLASEAVSAIRTVSSLLLEKDILGRYQAQLDKIVGSAIKSIFWTMFWFSLSQSMDFLCMGLAFWYGGQLVSTGEYTTDQFYIVVVAVIFGGQAAAQFFAYTTSMTKGASSANYILWLRSLQSQIREDSSNEDKEPKGDGFIEMNSLEFSYPQRPEAKVLKGVSLTVFPGQFVAFVGASGCGKSTLISLLERFYDPSSGTLHVDGKDVTSYSPRLYRLNIALVQQEPVLFRGSIRQNVALGLDGDATEEQIKEACRQANILEFVQSLPDGLGTSCGARGLQLSGGQRQRLAIARAMIREPKLLLLDEATSALDTESEKIVQHALEKVSVNRTTIAVAHRLSTIKNADHIFVFSHGNIVEHGNHSELLRKGRAYYAMCVVQSLDQA